MATDVPGCATLLGKNTKFTAPQHATTRRELRAIMYRLRDAMRHLTQSERARDCGYRLIQLSVKVSGIRSDRGMRAHYDGLLRCGLVWICPVCSLQIRAERAREVERAVAQHGLQRVCMLTLTIRHSAAHDLLTLLRGLNAGYARMTSNNPWKKRRRSYGVLGTIRALEETYGACGWHPHLHVLLFFERALSESERMELEDWIREHWPRNVAAVTKEELLPDDVHGVRLTTCYDGRYVSKMHLEITAPRGKATKRQNRNVWDILNAWDIHGKEHDAELIREHERAMRGMNALRWSKGLKARFGIGQKSDEEIVAGDAQDEVLFAMLGAEAWRAVRRIRGAAVGLLEAAESGGFPAVAALMRKLCPGIPLGPRVEPWESPTPELWEDIQKDGTDR